MSDANKYIPFLDPAREVGKFKQADLDTEIVTLAFGAADTSKTVAVTTGSIIIGQYVSAVTLTPVASHCKLSISGTTLTGTLSAAPGTNNALTITVVLLKV